MAEVLAYAENAIYASLERKERAGEALNIF
jgi:hypothetical protein